MSAGPRIPLIEPGTRPELAAIERAIAAERGHISALYQALLNIAPLAEAGKSCLPRSVTGAPFHPIVRDGDLRVAVLNRAPFEFAAHLPVARNAGVSDEKLAALQCRNRRTLRRSRESGPRVDRRDDTRGAGNRTPCSSRRPAFADGP